MSTYHLDPEASNKGGVTLVKLSGGAQPEAIVRSLDELNALAERDSSLRVLIDETDLRAGLVGPSDIARIVRSWRNATHLRSARIAAFATNPVIYGLNRMFQGLVDGAHRVSVFNDRARALAWLLEG